jgi:hypothetical protein
MQTTIGKTRYASPRALCSGSDNTKKLRGFGIEKSRSTRFFLPNPRLSPKSAVSLLRVEVFVLAVFPPVN